MRVLQINSTLNWGSTGRIAEDIGKAVIAIGGESYIAYGRHANSTQSKSIQIGNKWNIYYHVIETRLFDRHGLASKKATKKLIDKIKEINPHIIHLHNIHGYYLNYPVLFNYLSSSNIPIIWTLHDCWAFTGHCSHYSFMKCYQWQSYCYNCCQRNNYPQSLFFDNCRQNYYSKKKFFTSIEKMVLVAVSDWLKNEVEKSFLSHYEIIRIYNGIDLNLFFPYNTSLQELGLPAKFIILGVASAWDTKKGINDFIELSKTLSADFQIVLLGLTEKQKANLPNDIIGISRTNNIVELAKYYSIADVYINFSVEESLGLTTCEAMACGTPVIVYNSTACPEVVSDDTGFVIEPGDLEGAVCAINKIKLVGKNAFSKACRERVIRHFNKEDRYAEYLQLYKKILINN